MRQLDQCDEILDWSFDGRKHCHPHHSEACRDHRLGGTGNGSFIVCSIRDCHFMFLMDERRWRLRYVLRYCISMAMKLCAISIRWGFWFCSFVTEFYLSHMHMFNEDYSSLFVCWFVVIFWRLVHDTKRKELMFWSQIGECICVFGKEWAVNQM